MNDEFLWTEIYRPKTIKDTVLPESLKSVFQNFVDTNKVPNMILSGSSGIGKTTVAKAMLDELDCDYIVINGSLDGNISTLRNDIKDFASSVSFKKRKKYVILDEADYLNPNSTQPALRNFMEEYSSNCGFILTCNFKNRIIIPLHSRCTVIDFKIDKQQQPKMAVMFMKRTETILTEQNIKYDRAYPALSANIMPTFNNMRGYTVSGFYAWSYGADFLIFNATDFAVKLDDTAAGFLRIAGVAFTQNTTYTLTVDDLYKKRSNLLDTAVGKDVTLYNPFRVNEDYNELKNSRIKYGRNAFSIESVYLQSTDAAENVFGWIVSKVSKPRLMIGVNTFGMSNIQLGDILKVNYITNEGIYAITNPNKNFVVYQIDYAKGSDGYNNTMYLAEV